jgi:hypothetical protein
MPIKKLNSISLNSLAAIKEPSLPFTAIAERKPVGILLKESSITNEIYSGFAQVNIPYILIIDIPSEALIKNVSDQTASLAERILPLLMHYSQYDFFASKPLFFKIPTGTTAAALEKWNEALLQSFKRLGFRNISLYYNKSASENGQIAFETLLNNEADSKVIWEVTAADNVPSFELQQNPIDQPLSEQENVLQLREENAKLKSDKSTLLKNINDLNNYYRFVRGEVNFKYHNRAEDDKNNTDDNVGLFTNATPGSSLMSVEQLRAYYNKVYEQLPGWYKKIGTILKIVFLKRELMYYINKKHKKVFLDIIQALPTEKQIITWYYYEYEILPGWYKRIGSGLINKKQ